MPPTVTPMTTSAVLVPVKMEENPSPPPSPLPLPDKAPSCFFPNGILVPVKMEDNPSPPPFPLPCHNKHQTSIRPLKRIYLGGPATNTRSMSRTPAENTRSKCALSALRVGLSARSRTKKKKITTRLFYPPPKVTIAQANNQHINSYGVASKRRLTLITQENHHPVNPWMTRRIPQVCVKK